MVLVNPKTLDDYIKPHTIEWYQQLGNLEEEYLYPWNSTILEPNGESVFDKEVKSLVVDKEALDVGCGHGELTVKLSEFAKKIVGFDVTEPFIRKANQLKTMNTEFIVGSTKEDLPFKSNEFDCAFIRKGPTSAYLSLKQVVKKDGEILGLHPNDENGKELPALFPSLFDPIEGTPILDSLSQKLKKSSFTYAVIQKVESKEYLHTPLDVIKLRCFGQKPKIYYSIVEKNLSEVTEIFDKNAGEEGLAITNSYYIVRGAI